MSDVGGPKHILLMGIQGSGKGTQGERLSAALRIPTISTGVLLRDNIKRKTEIGLQIQAIIEGGNLVPDSVSGALVAARLQEPDAVAGWILDGYPRNVQQANDLDTFATVTHVIAITISDAEAVRRITGRRQCSQNHIYHVEFNPPAVEGVCDICGGALVQRADDVEESVRKRLEIFHEMTQPLIALYEERGLVHRINGEQTIEEVQKDVFAAVGV